MTIVNLTGVRGAFVQPGTAPPRLSSSWHGFYRGVKSIAGWHGAWPFLDIN